MRNIERLELSRKQALNRIMQYEVEFLRHRIIEAGAAEDWTRRNLLITELKQLEEKK